jgi:hypothetical protein
MEPLDFAGAYAPTGEALAGGVALSAEGPQRSGGPAERVDRKQPRRSSQQQVNTRKWRRRTSWLIPAAEGSRFGAYQPVASLLPEFAPRREGSDPRMPERFPGAALGTCVKRLQLSFPALSFRHPAGFNGNTARWAGWQGQATRLATASQSARSPRSALSAPRRAWTSNPVRTTSYRSAGQPRSSTSCR